MQVTRDQLAAALGHWLVMPPETAWLHALPCLRARMAEAVAAPTVAQAVVILCGPPRWPGTRGMAEAKMTLCREAAKEAM